jgi:hypothetical protein
MDAVTYPDDEVSDFVGRYLVPLRLPFNHEPLSTQFNVKWTPTLITLDEDGQEHHRTVGFLAPKEFMASQLLGIAKTDFDRENFEQALLRLNMIIDRFNDSDAAAEAIFLKGVSLYKSTHDPKPLRAAYDRLSTEYAGSEWTKRAYPYRLIPA